MWVGVRREVGDSLAIPSSVRSAFHWHFKGLAWANRLKTCSTFFEVKKWHRFVTCVGRSKKRGRRFIGDPIECSFGVPSAFQGPPLGEQVENLFHFLGGKKVAQVLNLCGSEQGKRSAVHARPETSNLRPETSNAWQKKVRSGDSV